MNNKIFLLAILLITAISLTAILQSCKDNSPVQTNTTNNNQGAAGPVLLNPQNQTSVQILRPALQWSGYQSASSYRVQVSMDANFAGIMIADSSGITGTQFTFGTDLPAPATYYYWHVIATTPQGLSPWSLTWRFNVIFNAPAAPVLLSPSNNSTGVPFLPLFDWTDVATAQFYRIQVSQVSNFSQITLDSNFLTVSQFQCPIMVLNTNTQYFWRANASNSNGSSTGPWSTTWNFTTVTGPQPNTISGRVTFADTNFAASPIYYVASAFSPAFWPPTNPPFSRDSIIIQKVAGVYFADYKIKQLYNGSYYICIQATDPTRLSSNDVLGIWGCDTTHIQNSSCPFNPTQVFINNNNGVDNINFLTWADTSKRIF